MKEYSSRATLIEVHKSRSPLLIDKKTTERSLLKKCLVLICAYNEEKSIPYLLESLTDRDVLVIDDGSFDRTQDIATKYATVLAHVKRLGKAASLADGISYAVQNSYDTILEIDADTIPKPGSISCILNALEPSNVGAVSCNQIPLGPRNTAFFIDELMWALLNEGKRLQMESDGFCHLGAVMVAFKPELAGTVEGSINDDEELGREIQERGYKVIFEEDAQVYFDASSCIGHIVERRRRMYYGHMIFARSNAPSMKIKTSALALMRAILAQPKRIAWVLPAFVLDFYARLIAWRDSRDTQRHNYYSRWVTSYEKTNPRAANNCRSD